MMVLTAREPMAVMIVAKRLPTAPAEQNMVQVVTMQMIVEIHSPVDQRDSVSPELSLHSPISQAPTAGPGHVSAPTAEAMLAVMQRSCGVVMR